MGRRGVNMMKRVMKSSSLIHIKNLLDSSVHSKEHYVVEFGSIYQKYV